MATVEWNRAASALTDLLSKYPATAPHSPTPESMVIISSDSSLMAAFQTLIDNSVLSAPVYDYATKAFAGFLDCRDLVAFCVFASNDNNWNPTLEDLIHVGTKMNPIPVVNITATYLAKRHPFLFVYTTDSLLTVANKLSQRDCHRVPVVDKETQQMVALITQSAFITWVYDNRQQLGDALQCPISSIGKVGSSPVISVPASTPVIETFTLMDTHNISGVGILSPQGNIIATTSVTDIKKFLTNCTPMSQSILSFIQTLKADQIDIRAPFMCVALSNSLEEVIGRMSQAKVHRVFVIDESNQPIGVISITDIMKILANWK